MLCWGHCGVARLSADRTAGSAPASLCILMRTTQTTGSSSASTPNSPTLPHPLQSIQQISHYITTPSNQYQTSTASSHSAREFSNKPDRTVSQSNSTDRIDQIGVLSKFKGSAEAGFRPLARIEATHFLVLQNVLLSGVQATATHHRNIKGRVQRIVAGRRSRPFARRLQWAVAAPGLLVVVVVRTPPTRSGGGSSAQVLAG